ncbi:MAG: hypothetical protein ACXW1N_08250 [Halobacteriota archaeon]
MNKTNILSATSVIILGALGSGFWELIKPLLGWAWTATIAISTLGLDSLRDGIYVQSTSYTGFNFETQIILCMILFLSVLTVTIFVLSGSLNDTGYVIFYQRFLLVLAITLCVATLRTAYVGQLSKYYKQLEMIAAPHINDLEMKQYQSKLAQVQTRDDFLKIVKSLSDKIAVAGEKAPTRTFF